MVTIPDLSNLKLPQKLDSNQLVPIVSIATATVLTAYAIKSALSSKKKLEGGYKEIPVAKGNLPYIGHLHLLDPEVPGYQINAWQKELGPIMKLHMGVRPWILISDSTLAQEVFVRNGSATSARPFQTYGIKHYSLDGRGIVFSNPTKRWKRTRTAALSILAPKSVDRFSDIMTREADYIVNYLVEESEKNNGLFPIKPLQFSALNIILTIVLGIRTSSPKDPLFIQISNAIDTSIKFAGVPHDISSFLPILSFLDILHRKEAKFDNFASGELRPLFRRLIKEALEGETDCLTKSFYELKEEYELEDDDILISISDLLGGGGDTISITLSWIIAILCHFPDVQKKLRDEVDAFITANKRLPTFNDRESLPYLIAVNKECMRYRPMNHFGLPHEAEKDIVCQDYFIPKGSTLICNMLGMHHNPNRFENPEEFIPERFVDVPKTMLAAANGNIEARDHYNFGWGRRICPGIYMAEVEMFNVLVRIFAQSIIKPPVNDQGNFVYPNLDKVRNGGLVVLPEVYKVRFEKRTDAVAF